MKTTSIPVAMLSKPFKLAITLQLAFALALFVCLSQPVLSATVLKGGTTEASNYEDAVATEAPKPEIPSELKERCLKTCCTVRFSIKSDGKQSVAIVNSSGSEDVDEIALATLRRWKFKPALLNGNPVESTRKIRVEFEIE